jgi:hypothetical protein
LSALHPVAFYPVLLDKTLKEKRMKTNRNEDRYCWVIEFSANPLDQSLVKNLKQMLEHYKNATHSTYQNISAFQKFFGEKHNTTFK